MSSSALKETDPLDIDEAIECIEKSFGIQFIESDLKTIKTFGEFCELVNKKTNSHDMQDCTTQQTFYKLRHACELLPLNLSETISPKTELKIVFPKNLRKDLINKFQEKLGLNLDILHPPEYLEVALLISILVGFVLLFFTFKIGLAIFLSSYIGLYIAKKLGNNFRIVTFGDLANKVTNENYTRFRSTPHTTNKHEVQDTVKQIFCTKLGLKSEDLNDEASFV